jgi:hypothetical protein
MTVSVLYPPRSGGNRARRTIPRRMALLLSCGCHSDSQAPSCRIVLASAIVNPLLENRLKVTFHEEYGRIDAGRGCIKIGAPVEYVTRQ